MNEPDNNRTLDLLADSLQVEWESLVALTPRALAAFVLFGLFLLVGRLLGRAVTAVMRRGDFTTIHQTFGRNLVTWLVGFLGLAAAMNILGLGGAAAGLLAGGGLTAVILGFAFREIGENFLAGLFLAFSRPFRVGDTIESGGFKGTVRSIELRYTHVRTLDGRDIYIPNARIFKDPLINYTRDGLLRDSFIVGVDYGDDVARASELLLATVREVEGVLEEPAPSSLPANLAANWVEIEVQFWVDTFRKDLRLAAVRGAALEASRRALEAEGYTFSTNVVSRLAVDLREAGGSG